MSSLKQLSAPLLGNSQPSSTQFQTAFAAALEKRPKGIHWGLDHPQAATEIYTTLLVEGWACAQAGLEAIAIYINGELIEERVPQLARPDVAAALPQLPAAATSGFSTTIHLEDLRSAIAEQLVLTVAFRDRRGGCAVAERTVSVRAFRHPLSASLENRPQGIYWGINRFVVPHYETAGTVPLVGWACARAGLSKIALYLDGDWVEDLQPSLARPDVAASFPTVPDTATSGFFTTVALTDTGVSERILTLAFYDRAGRCAVAELPLHLTKNNLHYHRYFLATLPSQSEAALMLSHLRQRSLTLPQFEWWVWGDSLAMVTATLQSLAKQQYPAWVAHLVAPIEQWPALQALIADVMSTEQQVQLTLHTEAAPTPETTSPLHYIGLIRAGEILAPHALVRWATALTIASPDLSYSDSDRVKPSNLRCEAHFKPDWSPDYALSRHYVGDLYLARKTPAVTQTVANLAAGDGTAGWRYDLWLRLTEAAETVHHVPEALWSEPDRDIHNEGRAQRELTAVEAALQRRQSTATVEAIAGGMLRRLHWPLPASPPLVSIIIPTTGRLNLVQPLVESLLSQTRYHPYELIFIDNGRGQHPEGIAYLQQQAIRVIEHDAPFNWSRLNNLGAAAAQGELLLFLNDDIEVITADWLSELVAQASRSEVGVVGTLLLYPDGRIQHGGIFLVDQGGGVCHSLQYLDPQTPIYQHLDQVVREVISNTGACLMMRRSLFEAMAGFDESYEIVGSDIDLTLRVHAAGYRNLWTPFAKLVHHESVSRQRTPVRVDEERFWQQWGALLTQGDPYYNPNLTQDCSDCSLREVRLAAVKSDESATASTASTSIGINLISFIRAETGLGEAARGLASAIAASNTPFGIVEYINFNKAQMGDDTWLHKVIPEPIYDVNIIHMNADLLPHIVQSLPPQYFAGRYQIGYWAWELPEFPDEWLASFDWVDEVWVPSQFVQQAVARKATVPVTCIPHTVEKTEPIYLNRDYFQLPSSQFLFLMMYDLFSYTARKNPLGAIAAFQQAFAPSRQDVGLVIKVNNASADEILALREAIGDAPSVYLLEGTLSRYEVDSLIHSCDCYVSLHRAEGFGLGMAEAMALGRPAIATHWSGNTDFMNPSNAACIGYELQQLGQDYGPYKADQYWAEPDINEAAQWMRRLADDPAQARQLGVQAQHTIAQHLSPSAIGQQIRQRLLAIAQHRQS